MAVNRISALVATVFAVLIGAPQTVTGQDDPAHESLADVTIGRVFFSPEERDVLDDRQRVRPSAPDRHSQNSQEPAQTDNNAAGYIVSSSGRSQIYSNGDFVAGDVQKEMIFPGRLKIVRIKKKQSPSDQTETSESGPSDAAE